MVDGEFKEIAQPVTFQTVEVNHTEEINSPILDNHFKKVTLTGNLYKKLK
jgi:hypothetical protein